MTATTTARRVLRAAHYRKRDSVCVDDPEERGDGRDGRERVDACERFERVRHRRHQQHGRDSLSRAPSRSGSSHNGECSGTPASVQTGVAVGGHSAATGALDEGSYGFQAMYVAGDDPNHNDSAWSACEPFNVQGLVDLAITKSGSPATQDLGRGTSPGRWWSRTTARTRTPASRSPIRCRPATPRLVDDDAGHVHRWRDPELRPRQMTAGQQVTITLVTTPSRPGTQTNTATCPATGRRRTWPTTRRPRRSRSPAPFVPPCTACDHQDHARPADRRAQDEVTIHLTQDGGGQGHPGPDQGRRDQHQDQARPTQGCHQAHPEDEEGRDPRLHPDRQQALRSTKRIGVRGVFTPPVTG